MPVIQNTILILFAFSMYTGSANFAIHEGIFTNDTINQVDNNGMKQGHWVITKNDIVIEEGLYFNNKKEGIWKAYYDNRNLKHEIHFIKGEARGTAHFYYEDGKIRESGNWQIDHWEGSYKYFYESGQLSYDWYYNEEGKRQGEQRYYHTNGEKMYEGQWEDGKTEGTLKVYSNTGELIQEKVFNEGKFAKIKQPSPEKHSTAKFKGTGFHTIVNLDGQIDEKGFFVKGNLFNGQKHNYNKEGILISISTIKNGNVIEVKDQNLDTL